jgi:hypothetical protein
MTDSSRQFYEVELTQRGSSLWLNLGVFLSSSLVNLSNSNTHDLGSI